MIRGMYRDEGVVQVDYHDTHSIPISADLYELRGYLPLLAELPTREEYEKKNAQGT